MKKASPTIVLFTVLLALFSNAISAQNIHGQAIYQYKTTIDLGNLGKRELSEQQKKIIASRMKHKLEKTYVLNFNESESVYSEEESRQGGGFQLMTSGSSYKTMYKSTKEKKVLIKQDFFGEAFLIDGSLAELEWKKAEETKQIGEYTCNKATALTNVTQADGTSISMQVTAWYAKEIAVNQGPAEYWGLPGLILEINTDKISIQCSKIILNPSEETEIIKPSKGKKVTASEYSDIVKKKLMEMQ
ncbi:GLPGLI family protein [Mangrovimonas spongiae]|uniref:GLPGLI family protein n=1 Tax=Mangrovimonas spongiae TaxID=2494697 RepID=A0A3R9UTP5_9FLAO|nr:GLPGLI family protein [Mangrovimonas spongiae]RSK39886.1 GLPGLI family protein [Mangrovimonas spongiae]